MRIVIFLIIGLFAVANEPSAFEAGNLDSPNPYGLTKDEKAILANKKEIDTLKKRVYSLQSKFNSLQEKLVGIESVVEGLDEGLNAIKKDLKSSQSEEVSQEIALLRKDLNTTIAMQKENFKQIRTILKELTSMIDRINATYISKEEFKRELQKIYQQLGKSSMKSLSGRKLYQMAYKAYKQKDFEKAQKLFKESAAKHYKPAASNFYAGESCYYSKDYACAVEHYKKSASLYAKASYMPTLLLHTAISLEKLGQKREAKKFFSTLIKLYPKSKAAQIAKKHI